MYSMEFGIEMINEFSVTTYHPHSNRTNNLLVEHPFLYLVTSYGLEIYAISNDGTLALLSRTSIIDAWSLEKIGSYVFISTSTSFYDTPAYNKLYKIDVADPSNPGIVQWLEFNQQVAAIGYIHKVNDHLLLQTYTYGSYYPLLNTNLEIVNTDPLNNSTPALILNDDLVLARTGMNSYQIFDFSDLDDISVIGSGDISLAHQDETYSFNIYQDNVLIFNNQLEISFWDISDLNDWQLLHSISLITDPNLIIYGFSIAIINDYLVYLNPMNLVVMDLTDYSYVQQLELDMYMLLSQGGLCYDFWDNNLYITTSTYGIKRYRLEEDEFVFIESIGEEKYNHSGYMIGDFFFIGSGTWSIDGIAVYDVSNPLQIEEINRFEGENHIGFRIIDGLLYIRRYPWEENMEIELYDISDPLNPLLRNTIDLMPWLQIAAPPIEAETDQNAFYVLLPSLPKLLKFDISMPGEVTLLFELNLPHWSLFIDDDLLYLLAPGAGSYWHDLRIYNGLNQNEPSLYATIENFVFHPSPIIWLRDDYLVLYMWEWPDDNVENKTSFYDLSEPMNPEHVFDIEVEGHPFIKDDVMFIAAHSTIYVFDISPGVTGTAEPVAHFSKHGWRTGMFFQEIAGNRYLYSASEVNVGVYEYSYTVNTDDDIVAIPAVTSLFQNYPNPFNPETKIEFYLEKGGEVKLEIFNIRGQRLATLIDEELPQGEHSLIWNPKTAKGKDLPSGVYLYRLQSDNYEKTRKMLYLK
jgi:hypothetical protein